MFRPRDVSESSGTFAVESCDTSTPVSRPVAAVALSPSHAIPTFHWLDQFPYPQKVEPSRAEHLPRFPQPARLFSPSAKQHNFQVLIEQTVMVCMAGPVLARVVHTVSPEVKRWTLCSDDPCCVCMHDNQASFPAPSPMLAPVCHPCSRGRRGTGGWSVDAGLLATGRRQPRTATPRRRVAAVSTPAAGAALLACRGGAPLVLPWTTPITFVSSCISTVVSFSAAPPAVIPVAIHRGRVARDVLSLAGGVLATAVVVPSAESVLQLPGRRRRSGPPGEPRRTDVPCWGPPVRRSGGHGVQRLGGRRLRRSCRAGLLARGGVGQLRTSVGALPRRGPVRRRVVGGV